MNDLADFLRSVAQNDYMIDNYFLETGARLHEIANEIERLRGLLREAIDEGWIDRDNYRDETTRYQCDQYVERVKAAIGLIPDQMSGSANDQVPPQPR